eukprot:CAMPEP_0197196640 /NCGR_PEP_ID=MMETSP1423-20130617/32462_1 /TAXON_ID=476441 /ORGANISM="Pseudo-nitzschia heimii, Strain UNC1101" /LENGTH=816 /DNA_ID=CAMNT_0042650451 /DNA_START=651 /DNA_END=3101 /DNA_ORIENTATION=+
MTLKRDSDDGEDLLDLIAIARIFADQLASKSLIPPFVLGILGDLGSGKTFFLNLIKKNLIDIQKNKKAGCVDRMYLIRFNAWTTDDLLASMMFRIYRDLSCQMELEETIKTLGEAGTSDGKRISVIELYDKLSSAERQFFNGLKGTQEGGEFVQMKKDQEELKRFEKELKDEAKRHVWEKAIEDYEDSMNGGLSNAFTDIVVKKMKAQKERKEKYADIIFNGEINIDELKEHISNFDLWTRLSIRMQLCWNRAESPYAITATLFKYEKYHNEKYRKMLNKGPAENFSNLSPLVRLLVSVKNSPFVFLFLLILIITLVVAMIYFDGEIKIRWEAITGSVVAFAPIFRILKKTKDSLEKATKEFSEQIERVTNGDSDIEAFLTSSSDRAILMSKKKIRNIKNKLKVLEGESLQQLVNDRVKSNFYVEQLGILHQAQEDLFKLSDAMYNRYNKDNEEARIVLFIDDLDRCEPEKVIEVLEAMHLLVNTELFVVVVTIDSRYVCLSLENIQKYKNILHQDRSPTGMDFLGKIIQVPFRLPAMSDAAIHRYVEDHVDVDRGDEDGSDAKSVDGADKSNSRNPSEDDEDGGDGKSVDDADHTNNRNSSEDTPILDPKGDDQNDNMLVACLSTQIISEDGLKALKDVCKVFKLGPRRIKYLINVYNLMSRIWKEDKVRNDTDTWKGTHVGRNSLFLLAMASCENTRDGIAELFDAMHSKDDLFQGETTERNLSDIVCDMCRPKLKPSQEVKIKELFDDLLITSEDWNDFCRHFELARCFSFSYKIDDAKASKQPPGSQVLNSQQRDQNVQEARSENINNNNNP